MNHTFDISVIIPMYNAEKFIENTINSVTSQQEHGLTYEIIVVDDKSTDSSLKIVENIKNEKVRIVELESNGGLSNARNSGMKVARGKWIQFLDSDDTICDDLFRKFEMALKPGINCYIFSFIREEYEFTLKQTIREIKDIRAFAHFGGTSCNKFIKRDICIEFKKGYISEDICFSVDMMNQIPLNLALIDNAYYHYNKKNEKSITANFSNKEFNKMFSYIYSQIPKSNKYTKMFILEMFIAFLFQKSIPVTASLPKAMLVSIRLLNHLPGVIMNQNRKYIENIRL